MRRTAVWEPTGVPSIMWGGRVVDFVIVVQRQRDVPDSAAVQNTPGRLQKFFGVSVRSSHPQNLRREVCFSFLNACPLARGRSMLGLRVDSPANFRKGSSSPKTAFASSRRSPPDQSHITYHNTSITAPYSTARLGTDPRKYR